MSELPDSSTVAVYGRNVRPEPIYPGGELRSSRIRLRRDLFDELAEEGFGRFVRRNRLVRGNFRGSPEVFRLPRHNQENADDAKDCGERHEDVENANGPPTQFLEEQDGNQEHYKT